MDGTLVVLLATGAAAASVPARHYLRSRRTERLREAELYRLNRRLASEDITRFGEELVELHTETLATELDNPMREDYQQALDAYEEAKAALTGSSAAADVTQVAKRLEEGRWRHARVLARRDGRTLPERLPPCFFDPGHGPATTEVTWSPPHGVEREIPVCARDAQRLVAGEAPDVRMVRLGNRHVPWYAAGPAYTPWATGWYGRMLASGRLEADQLTMMFLVGFAATSGVVDAGGWSDPGGWTPNELGIGHEYGYGGDGGGGYDPGGGFDLGGGGDGGGAGGGDVGG
jgi:hypothetical protein